MNYLDEIVLEMSERDILRGVMGEAHRIISPNGDYNPWHHDAKAPVRTIRNTVRDNYVVDNAKTAMKDSVRTLRESTYTLEEVLKFVSEYYQSE
jgi:hypothetical protein